MQKRCRVDRPLGHQLHPAVGLTGSAQRWPEALESVHGGALRHFFHKPLFQPIMPARSYPEAVRADLRECGRTLRATPHR